MANPFKTAENPVTPVTPSKKEAPVVAEVVEEKAHEIEKPVAPKKEKKRNPLAGLVKDKPKARSYALYLDDDVVAEIDRLAKEGSNLNRSKIANALLRRGLFDE